MDDPDTYRGTPDGLRPGVLVGVRKEGGLSDQKIERSGGAIQAMTKRIEELTCEANEGRSDLEQTVARAFGPIGPTSCEEATPGVDGPDGAIDHLASAIATLHAEISAIRQLARRVDGIV